MPTVAGTNYPGEYEVEIQYQDDGGDHIMKLNCNVSLAPSIGDLVTAISLSTKSGGTVILDTAVQAFVDLIKARLTNDTTFVTYNFFRYTVGTFDRTWISSGNLSQVGTASGSNVVDRQETFTFRSNQGGKMRLVLLGGPGDITSQNGYAGLIAAQQAIVDFMLSNDSWMVARDNGYPAAFLKGSNTQNEALYKKNYR